MKTATLAALLLVFALSTPRPALAQRFTQTNLVSDLSGAALRMDANLVNPWGLAPGASGVFWAANNVTGTSTLYDPDGTIRPLVVTIPGGAPTGIVATSAGDSAFDVPNGATSGRAAFIFVTQNGTIAAWSPAVNQTLAIEVATDPGTIYTGAALGGTRVNPLLYVANFSGNEIEVYDTSFAETKLAGNFTDPNLPAGYFPFNIANIGGQLYVAYAQQKSPGEELPGPGLGVVSVFDLQGNFVRRFATGSQLNAPWAVVQAPAGFGPFGGDILVGNFGNGQINAFDAATGAFEGALLDTVGSTIRLSGLWGLSFGKPAASAAAQRLYFAAGIEDETHGLFGYIAAKVDTTSPPPVAGCDDNESKGQKFWAKACKGPQDDNGHGHAVGVGANFPGFGKGGDGDDGDDDDGDHDGGHGGVAADSLDGLFACVSSAPAPNAFGAGGCFTAGCDLLKKGGHRSDLEEAAQVLLVTRLNLCSGLVCDSLAIRCGGNHDGTALTVGEAADALDVLLCENGDKNEIKSLVKVLNCALDDEGGDDQGEDEDDARAGFNHKVAIKTNGVARLGAGPVNFAVNATSPSMVQLRIYDVRGRLVAEPMHNTMVSGSANVNWDGNDLRGRAVAPGTYFYRAVTAGEATTGRLLIVR